MYLLFESFSQIGHYRVLDRVPCALSMSLLVIYFIHVCASYSFVSDSLWPPDYSCQAPLLRNFPAKNTGVGCHAHLQGIFPTQGSNPSLPHCRCILYHLSHERSPHFIHSSVYISISVSQFIPSPLSPSSNELIKGLR